MPLPGSGSQISLKDILDEKQGSTTARTNVSLKGLSVDGVNDYDSVDISGTPNGSAPYGVAEFQNYSQDFWSSNIIYSPSTVFTQTHQTVAGGTVRANTMCVVTWNSNGNHTVQWRDYAGSTVGGTLVPSPATTFTAGGSFSSLQVRWKFVNYNRTISAGADSGDKVSVNFHSANADVFTGTSSTATDQNFTSSWQSCLPSALGGVNANSQTNTITVLASGGGTAPSFHDAIQLSVPTNDNGYVSLQYRANNDDNKIIEFRNNNATGVSLYALSEFESEGFTCIMPNMLVEHETKGLIPIGDIIVGDRILAQGDLNDTSVEPQWATVTEARTHTREGYWNVQAETFGNVPGLHITNDHPIWLTNDSGSAWVKVEDINMPGSIKRNYINGSVDPVYLGTNPGHYYVYTGDLEGGDGWTRWTVSGDYAPGSE